MATEFGSAYPVFSYTATKMEPREVAKSFVPPPGFQTLRNARNAILVGPRGSGKTTLLKMLTSEGLAAWDAEEADLARRSVQDAGVFIGVDAMWSEQIMGNTPATRSFGAAAYALHIARAFIKTVLFRAGRDEYTANLSALHLPISLSKVGESRIAARTAELFKLPASSASLTILDSRLGDRLNELGTYRYRVPDGQNLPEWAYLNPLHSIAELAQLVNSIVGEGTRKWALLFDELELAPESIVADILRRLRGNEPTLIFKLSLSPILRSTDQLVGERGAIHGQDAEYIALTTPYRSDDFVAEIFEKQRKIAKLPIRYQPREVLGPSMFDAGDRGGRKRARIDPYRKGGRLWNSMDWLRRNDSTFAAYLKASKVDLDRLGDMPAELRSAKLRKIRNLAIVRRHFRGGARIDTQGTRALYTGEATMLAFPDGNPRMATIMVRELVSLLKTDPALPLSAEVQAAAIDATGTRFLALLHAQAGLKIGSRSVTMLDLVDAIGGALHRRIVDVQFSPDVPAGFFVDQDFPAQYLPLLTQAANTGAIVHIPRQNSSSPVAVTPRGRHYRLSYLLAPRYGLPVRQGKTVALWNLLEGSDLRDTSGRVARPALISRGEADG